MILASISESPIHWRGVQGDGHLFLAEIAIPFSQDNAFAAYQDILRRVKHAELLTDLAFPDIIHVDMEKVNLVAEVGR